MEWRDTRGAWESCQCTAWQALLSTILSNTQSCGRERTKSTANCQPPPSLHIREFESSTPVMLRAQRLQSALIGLDDPTCTNAVTQHSDSGYSSTIGLCSIKLNLRNPGRPRVVVILEWKNRKSVPLWTHGGRRRLDDRSGGRPTGHAERRNAQTHDPDC